MISELGFGVERGGFALQWEIAGNGRACEGGMGEVWRAAESNVNREVAIKVLPDPFAKRSGRTGALAYNADAGWRMLLNFNNEGEEAQWWYEQRDKLTAGAEAAHARGELRLRQLAPSAVASDHPVPDITVAVSDQDLERVREVAAKLGGTVPVCSPNRAASRVPTLRA